MSVTTLRASGDNQYDVMTDVERENASRQRQMQDFIVRKQLQDAAAQVQREGIQSGERIAGMSESGQDRRFTAGLSAQRDMQGTFADRSAAQSAMFDKDLAGQKELAAIKQRPQGDALDFDKTRYGDTRADGEPDRAYAARINQERIKALDGSPDAPMDGDLRHELLTGRERKEKPEDAMIRQFIATLAAKAAESGDTDSLKKFIDAMATGDTSDLPSGPAPQALGVDSIRESVLGRAKQFADKDTNMFGFDPTMQDVEGMAQQRDELARAIKAQNPRITDADAMQAANRLIEDHIRGQSDDSNAGWIKTLRQRLGAAPGN